jgi:hypothetical protein
VDQTKPKSLKKQKTKLAAHQSPSARTHAVATSSSAVPVPPTKLSLLDIVSGMGKRLFNLR